MIAALALAAAMTAAPGRLAAATTAAPGSLAAATTAGPGSLAAATTAAPGSLAAAQTAFSEGDYQRAAALAMEAAEPPQEGAALYLAGLALFRAGQPADALGALDRAALAPDSPAPALFHFNRAACLYELDRYDEAEADYLKAADLDGSLRTLSLVNAAYAALDRGAGERAKEIAGRARAAAGSSESELVDDLEAHIGVAGSERATAEYREGLAAYDAGRFEEARGRFRRASELDPADGRSLIMSGASSFRLGARGAARTDLEQALRRSLDDADARTARDYLDALSGGLSGRKRWEGAARLAAGFDNDPLQTGFFENNEFPRFSAVQNASPMATADVALAVRPRLKDDLTSEFAYAFDEVAYLDDAAADRSVQQHEIASALELAVRDDLRVGASITGQLAFTGVSKFRGLQAAAGGGAWATLDEGDATSTRLDLGWTRKAGLSEFDYLSGSRADAALTQELRFRSMALDVGYRFRADLIGSAVQGTALTTSRGCQGTCTQAFVEPLAYTGNTVWAQARTSGPRGSFELTAGYETRNYLDPSYDLLSFPDGPQVASNRSRRQDQRWFGGFAASMVLTRSLTLTLRYDLLLNRSAGDGDHSGPGRGFDPDARAYDRHVLLVGTTVTW